MNDKTVSNLSLRELKAGFLGLVLCLSIISLAGTYHLHKQNNIMSNISIDTAFIQDVRLSTRPVFQKIEYRFKGRLFEVTYEEVSLKQLTTLTGKKVLVAYDSTDARTHSLLITNKDFNRFNFKIDSTYCYYYK